MGVTSNVDLIIRDQSHRSLRRVPYFDPKTVTPRAPTDAVPADAHPNNKNSTINGDDEICITAVEDGMMTASVVVDVNTGYMELALPENYKTNVSTECIQYNEKMEREEVTRAFSSEFQYRFNACDRKFFQPGYYDHSTGFWHDACTGTGSQPIQSVAIMAEKVGPPLLTADNCPILSSIEKDMWVSFIGDSVTRQYVVYGLSGIVGDKACRDSRGCMVPSNVASWSSGRNGNDWTLVALGNPQSRKIWITYTFDFIIEGGELNPGWHGHFEKPFTWGDFVRLRKAGPSDDDPQFLFEKMPDIVFYSGGYHASTLTSSQYGAAVEEALVQYQDASKAHNVPMPQFHLLLNIMVSSVVVIIFYKTRQEDILSHDHVANEPSLQHT